MTDAFRPEDLIACSDRVRGLARRLVADDATADDVVQDACLAAMERPPREGTPRQAWLVRVVRNLAARTHRGRARRARREQRAAQPEAVPATAHVVAEIEAHRRLVDAVDRLGDPYRTAVVLRFFDGLAPREIAEQMQAPAATVSTWIHRGLAKLRADLDDGRGSLRTLLLPVLGRDSAPPAAPPSAPLPPLTTATAAATGVLMSAKKIAIAIVALLIVTVGVVGVVATSADSVAEPGPDLAARPESAPRVRTPIGSQSAASDTVPAAATSPTEEFPPPVDLESCDRDHDLFGRVVDADGASVPGAVISTESRPWHGIGSAGIEHSRERVTGPGTRSASDGTFAVRLERGQCVDLIVAADGFAPTRVTLCQAGERFDVVLRRGVELLLTVIDADGEPVPRARVMLRRGGNLVGKPLDPYEQSIETVTDADGRARVGGVRAGYVSVNASDPIGGGSAWLSLDVPREGRMDAELALSATRTVTGIVTDSGTGAPLAEVRVGSFGAGDVGVVTDDAGRYALPGVPILAATLRARAPGFELGQTRVAALDPGGDPPSIDFALIAGDRLVARFLLPDGAPAAGARVLVRARADPGRPSLRLAGVADAAGRLELVGLRHGVPHSLLAAAPSAGRTTLDFDSSPQPRGTVDLGDVVLGAERRIEGIACDTAGRPLSNVSVTLKGASGDRGRLRPASEPLSHGIVERRRTDDLGRFRFPGVAPGAYRLRLSGQDVPAAQWVDVVVPADRDLVDVRVTAPGDRSITLRLLDADGNALRGISVQAQGNFGWVEGRGSFLSLSSDADGRVVFRGLPAGETRFYCANLVDSPWVRTSVDPVVPDGQTIDVLIPRAARVEGEVRDDEGASMARMHVAARDVATDEDIAYAQTDEQGRFSLKVPGGSSIRVMVGGRRSETLTDGRTQSVQTGWRGETAATAPAQGVVVRVSDVPPERDRSLTVAVHYSTGEPAVGVNVSAHSGGGVGDKQPTDERGVAVLSQLPSDPVRVSVWCGHLSGEVPVGDLPPTELGVVANGQHVAMVFERGLKFRGRVVDVAGQPAPRGFVEVMTHDYRYVTVTIGADGRFAAGGLPERAHKLSARVYTSDGELTGVVEGVVPGADEVEIVVRPKPD